MKKIGFIGIGVMGKSMAINLLKNGYEVQIYSRTKEKALPVMENGAIWCDSIESCVKGCHAVITIVGYPKDVEEVYFKDNGIIANAEKGTYLIDMTTTSPKLSEKIYAESKKHGLKALDAPVSGGDTGAKNATLSIMVGGDEEDYNQCMPLLKCLGTNIIYEGGAGKGQHTKMANQIAIAGAMSGLCEAISYGKTMGLNTETMLQSISTGAAGSWQMSNLGPKILQEDFNPGFFIKHFIKDMKIALEESHHKDLSLPVLSDVLQMYIDLEKKNLGDLGTQGLIKHYGK